MSSIDSAADAEKIEQRHKDLYNAAQNYSARKLTFGADKAAAFSSITKIVTRLAGTEEGYGLLMSDVRKGLLWRNFPSLVGPRLDPWPSWSWFSSNGPVYFGAKPSSTPDEKAITKQLSPTFSQCSCDVNELIITQNVDKELRLRSHLIKAMTSKREGSDLTDIRMKEERVGFADFDFEDDARLNLDVFLLSLEESEEEKSKASSLPEHSCALKALVLLQKYDRSFQRVGTVNHLKTKEKKVFKINLKEYLKDLDYTCIKLNNNLKNYNF